MDPISALGAAAAGAQFVGIAVKTLLGAAKLFQGIKDDPKRAVELLAWIEEELISMQRLLHPDSPVFASLTTAQYVQVAPCAINARKALDKVKLVLSPLVDDIGRLKDRDDLGKKIMLLWKSLFTMKMMKDIESNLDTIRMLNATLLRELQICGFETQSLLREQSAQVFSIVVELSKRDGELLRSMEQFSTLQRQTLEETRLSKDALVHTLHALREAENDRYQELLCVQMTQFQAMQSMFRPQIDTTETLSKVGTDNKSSSNDLDSGITSKQIVKRKSKIQSSKSLRCKCYRNKFSSVHTFRILAFRTDWQPVQERPDILSPASWEPGALLTRNYKAKSVFFQLVWNGKKAKDRLAGVVRGIEEAVCSGVASYSDMDERGCTLLTELTLLFAYLGEVIFDVDYEMLQLFQMAFSSKLDPTTRFSEFSDGRSYGVLFHATPHLTLGATIVNYASSMGKISASLYEAFLEYEGLAESSSGIAGNAHLWKAITSDPSLSEALGYSDLSLAVISRSMERLEKCVYLSSGDRSSDHQTYSPLQLALGWPEGLQLLIDNDYGNVFRAFQLACQFRDIKSAATILSSKDVTLFTARPYWDNLDAILPPRKVPLHYFRYCGDDEADIAFKNDLEKSRDDEWHATLEEAGYKEWNFQDVIWDHCTKVLLKAHAYRQRVAAWKRHGLVSKPRFGRLQPMKFSQKQPEEE
ncbi:hypothetical protein PFICI_04803 [Pestalotiopsis fici W106-1]|uniref:Fungal N-terminal domain-containing protein n=1 Tax=Pestalotiopsis fici (strain W106-1 / CGMCC3.15140) TaxID=1229662 RepID=W3XBW8_PESFW|nr:uncharacterized protein PFICI_04803 [Pestalotiopsis fici W106-1]ETS82927.1 hypothetical protein PFICI_04803 [Pestalotiopsis fici W106-1]